jgi:hypothetical protein
LVCREAGVPDEEDGGDRWSLDHLFLDQDAVPTLIEVKRSTDTRLRREVVGQMLDYAANAMVYWPVQTIKAMFEARCAREGIDPLAQLGSFLENGEDTAQFWAKVDTNLQAGRVRLVFLADVIPSELQRVVEFLNGQMRSAEVLAVEVRRFEGPPGTEFRTIVPRVVGRTAEADRRKRPGDARPAGRVEPDELLRTLDAACGAEGRSRAARIIQWAGGRGMERGGTGLQITFRTPDATGETHRLLSLRYENLTAPPEGRLLVRMEWIQRTEAFAGDSRRKELIDRLKAACAGKVGRADGPNPYVRLDQIDASQLEAILAALDWAADLIGSA